MLKEWDEDEELQLAGLFHSIYGTEGFQDFQLSFDRRDDIKKLIGEVTGSKPHWTYREHCIRNRLVYAHSCTAHMPSSFWAPGIFAILKALCSVSGESDMYYTHTCGQTDLSRLTCAQRAEFCAFCNCVMDRTTLDATLSDSPGQHSIRARPDVAGGAHIPLSNSQFSDLITVHLADWLEQVRRRRHLQLLPCRCCSAGGCISPEPAHKTCV